MRTSRSRCLTTLLVVLALCTAVLAACVPDSTPSTSTTTQPPAGPPITVVPADGATAVNPLDPVSVGTEGGTLESVTMTNDKGKIIDGIVTPDRLAWKPGAPLGYNRTYTLAVTSVGDRVFGARRPAPSPRSPPVTRRNPLSSPPAGTCSPTAAPSGSASSPSPTSTSRSPTGPPPNGR